MYIPTLSHPDDGSHLTNPIQIHEYLQRFVFSGSLVLLYNLPSKTSDIGIHIPHVRHYTNTLDNLDPCLLFHAIQIADRLDGVCPSLKTKGRSKALNFASIETELSVTGAKTQVAKLRSYLNARGWDIVVYGYKLNSRYSRFISTSPLMFDSVNDLHRSTKFDQLVWSRFKSATDQLATTFPISPKFELAVDPDYKLKMQSILPGKGANELLLLCCHLNAEEARGLFRAMIRVCKDLDNDNHKPKGWNESEHGSCDTSGKGCYDLDTQSVNLLADTSNYGSNDGLF